MRRKIVPLFVSLLVSGSAPLHAQVPDWVNQVIAAATLPVVTAQLRQEGVANSDIMAVLQAIRTANIPAHDAVTIIETERAARRDNGTEGNFGAFVQSQLAAGKRGTDLAAAIHAEHARQGKGNAARGQGGGRSRGVDAGRGDGRGRGNDADNKQGNRGRGRPPTR